MHTFGQWDYLSSLSHISRQVLIQLLPVANSIGLLSPIQKPTQSHIESFLVLCFYSSLLGWVNLVFFPQVSTSGGKKNVMALNWTEENKCFSENIPDLIRLWEVCGGKLFPEVSSSLRIERDPVAKWHSNCHPGAGCLEKKSHSI